MQVQQVDEGSITPVELQAELDTLRSLRRRSISQPSEGIDPDLPPSPSKYSHVSPPASPKQLHYVAGPASDTSSSLAASSSKSSTLGRTPGTSNLASVMPEEEGTEDQPLADNLSELFWLPARLHPEIAPQEFRNFIRDQTKPENLLRRSGSQLGRRKSMLSRQYQPSDTETESASMFTSDAESTPSTSPSISRHPSRAGSFRRSTGLERLTLADLQKLESIARQAAEEGQTGDEGEAQLKRLVRRSLSLNPAAILGVADQLRDDDSFPEDDTDSPLIVPPPGSILRRSARTKIRKNSLLGDGGGHRFGPSRRGTRNVDSPTDDDTGRSSPGRRQASISSLNSLEDDGTGSGKERPVSAELRQRSPRSPRSPEKIHYAEPLPTQYIPPSGVTLAERMEAADLGPQDEMKIKLSPVRVGADLPPGRAASDDLQYTTTSPELASKLSAPNTGSLRSTRRIGSPVQASPEIQPKSSSTVAKASSSPVPAVPPVSAPLELPSSPGTSTLHLLHADVAAPADTRPAVPSKPSGSGTRSVGLQPSAPIAEGVNKAPGQNRVPHEKPIAKADPPSQTSRKGPASPAPTQIQPKEKEKKSTWAKLGLSRNSREEADVDDSASIASTSSAGSGTFGRKGKKTKKEKGTNEISPEKKAPLNSTANDKIDRSDGAGSFFGGLFGKKKADQSDQSKKEGSVAVTPMQLPTPPPTASGMLTLDGKYINFYRLPIHIERAVYRLSHIKLANPRRPLYEQVLISNLMFWYLGVINKPVVPPSQMQQRPQPQQAPPTSTNFAQATGSPSAVPDSNSSSISPAPRPPLLRENPSQAGPSGPLAGGAENGEWELDDASGSGSVASIRPASHPPSIARVPSASGESDDGLRSRPQTIPSGATAPVHDQPRSTPKQTSQPYRYQDYISTPNSSTALVNAHQMTSPDASTKTVPGTESEGEWLDSSTRRSRRFSSASAETDDVRYDSRRSTADMDTYDIISAYADEERRKSMLAQQSATQQSGNGHDRDTTPSSAPDVARMQQNGHGLHSSGDREHGSHKSVHRATPPRQSSMTAVTTYQGNHQRAIPARNGSRHSTNAPPPRATSPHTLPT